MTDNDKVVQLHTTPEVGSEERARRLGVEVERLAQLPPFEWLLYLDETARRHEVPPTKLKQMIEATIQANEKKAREAKADDRRERRQVERKQERDNRLSRQEQERTRKAAERARKEAERLEGALEAKRKKRDEEYERIAKLPRISHDMKLTEAAKRLGEDVETLRAEFAAYYVPDPTDTSHIEPWQAPVDTRALLQELVAQIRRYVVIHDLDVVAVALWIMFAWLHDIAIHSPILVVTSAEGDNGKTHLCRVIERLTPRAQFIAQPTGSNIYRIVDHLKPVMIIDDADRLLVRDTNLATILNASWVRGTKIPRMVNGELHYFDPFCPKCMNMIGLNMPPQTLSRCIIVRVLPKLREEVVEHFDYRDNADFIALRRKCMRLAADIAPALQHAYPEDFDRRTGDNWRLPLLIADLAGGDWPQHARAAAVRTAPKPRQKSLGNQLLAALRPILQEYKVVASADLQKMLTADKDSEWSNYQGRGRPISQREIALLLDPYEIHPDVVHPRAGLSKRGYKLEWFGEVFRRFLPSDNRTTVRPPARKPRKKADK